MRLALLGAAVGTALMIPGLAAAGDPRLLFEIRPPVAVVLENGGRRDALVNLEVTNPGERRVRVERFRATYFEGETPVGSLDPATSIFVRAGLLSDPRVEPGGRDRWTGLCVEPPTSATDRIRLAFDLVERRGVRTHRSHQDLDVPLRAPVAPPVIALPVQGKWRVTQGHSCETNHRRGKLGGEFAWDLAAINESGRSGTIGFDASHRNDESATFGRPVTAPIVAMVVAAVDGVRDNDERKEFPRRSLVDSAREPNWIFGNYVVLDAGRGIFVLLAHLRKGSIVVSRGDTVKEGAILGHAGNSGNSMLPHVHVQVMDRADPSDPDVSGVPARFRDFIEVMVSGDGRERDSVYRKVASGDPPEGAIVATPEPARPAP